MAAELKVSIPTYNEIANALDALGKKFTPGVPLTIEKDDKIINPIDWRLVTLRRDVSDIAAKVYAESDPDGEQTSQNFVRFASELYQFALMGTVPEEKGIQSDTPQPKAIPPKRTEPLTPAAKWK